MKKNARLSVQCALILLLYPLLASGQKPELVTQTNHTGWIQSVAFSVDGKLLATGGGDGNIKLWDLNTGRQIRTIEGHPGAKIEPNEKLDLAGSKDPAGYLFERIRAGGWARVVNSVAFSPDGKTLASGSSDQTIKIWDFRTGELKATFTQEGRVWFVAFNRDGTRLLSITEDDRYSYWDVVNRVQITKGLLSLNSFQLPWQSTGGQLSAKYSEKEKNVSIVDLRTKKEKILEGHSAGVRRAVFSPGGETLATCGWDTTVRLWDVKGNKEPKVLKGHTSVVSSVAFSRDGKMLASVGGDLVVKLWDVESGHEVSTLRGYTDFIKPLAFGKDDETLVTATGGTLHIWNMKTGRKIGGAKAHAGLVGLAVFNSDKSILATSDEAVIDMASLVALPELKTLVDAGPRSYAKGADKAIRLWDMEDGKLLKVLTGHTREVSTLAFSPDKKSLASGGDDSIKIWGVETEGEPTTLIENVEVTAVAFNSDGSQLASVDNFGTIRLWKVRSRNIWKEFAGQALPSGGWSNQRDIGFFPDDKTLVTYEDTLDGHQWFKLWDVETGQLEDTFSSGDINRTNEVLRLVPALLQTLMVETLDGAYYLQPGASGGLDLYHAEDNKLAAWMNISGEDEWAVVTPDGRFDSNNLERPRGLHWIFPDAPLTPLTFEIFMRDYYEPHLLPRLLRGDKLPDLPSLAGLNRLQPRVEGVTVLPQPGDTHSVSVSVRVASVPGRCVRGGRQVPCESGVYDLRLYRNGWLVGQYPDPKAYAAVTNSGGQNRERQLQQWRHSSVLRTKEGQPITAAAGVQTITFNNIRLPQRSDLSEVEFTAYAFNEDRVKSVTSEPGIYKLQRTATRVKRRAYVVVVGVDATSDPSIRLRFAPNGARDIAGLLKEKLHSQYEVVSVPLISEYTEGGGDLTQDFATKDNIRAALNLLSVSGGTATQRQEFPALQPATPDDLVVLYIASHGYADPAGKFYVTPSDIGEPTGVSEQLLDRCMKNSEQSESCKAAIEFLRHSISSDELAQWLQPIDADQMILILDSCHSAAVSGPSFKPGPMGDRSFGQLSYDKGMLVLAATQAENVAWATLELGDRSLLTDALVNQGPQDNDEPFDLRRWLIQAGRRVPGLYRKYVPQGEKQEQEPELFGFTRRPTAGAKNK